MKVKYSNYINRPYVYKFMGNQITCENGTYYKMYADGTDSCPRFVVWSGRFEPSKAKRYPPNKISSYFNDYLKSTGVKLEVFQKWTAGYTASYYRIEYCNQTFCIIWLPDGFDSG